MIVNASLSSGLQCIFNLGSSVIGCLAYLTNDATGFTYYRVISRSLDTPMNMSLCLLHSNERHSNEHLSAGIYSVDVYDVDSDGHVSPVPAITKGRITIVGLLPNGQYLYFSSFISLAHVLPQSLLFNSASPSQSDDSPKIQGKIHF